MKKPTITIVDYGVGNLNSVANMVLRSGAEPYLAKTAAEVRDAERIVLPGVGAFDSCRRALDQAKGLESALKDAVENGTPLLGICVGMQLLGSSSDEGTMPGLDLIPGRIRRFDPSLKENGVPLRVPHMGWRSVEPQGDAALFHGELAELNRFYFVHSYYFDCVDRAHSAGIAHYGHDFTAAVQRERIFGVQFHPEKSHRFGMALFRNFADIPPRNAHE